MRCKKKKKKKNVAGKHGHIYVFVVVVNPLTRKTIRFKTFWDTKYATTADSS